MFFPIVGTKEETSKYCLFLILQKQSAKLSVLKFNLKTKLKMEITPENQDQEKKPASEEQGGIKDNEELAREIPTVTPDDDDENTEPGPEENSSN